MHTLDLPFDLTPSDLPFLPGVTLTYIPKAITNAELSGDGTLTARFGDFQDAFLVNYKRGWSARDFSNALEQVRRMRVTYPALHPLVVLPYLDDDKLDALQRKDVSGLDLCGNAYLHVPNRWAARFTGRPNRFRADQTLRQPYAGKASLVGRTLLRRPAFPTASALLRDIERRGGSLSQALVSRALRELAEDLVVGERGAARVALLQPDKLLDRLGEAWKPLRTTILWRGKIARPTAEFLPRLFENAREAHVRAVMTGLGSASRHASITMEDVAYVYADRDADLLANLDARPTERFANLEVRRTPDDAVYFDADEEAGVRWASPVQTYLEMLGGDARTRDGARGLRKQLLEHAERALEVRP